MIPAVDSSVILDVVTADPRHADESESAPPTRRRWLTASWRATGDTCGTISPGSSCSIPPHGADSVAGRGGNPRNLTLHGQEKNLGTWTICKMNMLLLQEDLFEAVIGLAPNLFYGTGITASILVLNRDKPVERKGKVLFIDASAEFEEGTNQNRLRDQDIEHISKAFHSYAEVEKYARVVPLAEIEQNDWNLNIRRYVDTSDEEERIDIGVAVRKLRELEDRGADEATMNRYLAELEYDA